MLVAYEMSALAGGGVVLGLRKGGPNDGDYLLPFFRRGAGDEGPGRDLASPRRALKWYQAEEILGILGRQMRQWKQRY